MMQDLFIPITGTVTAITPSPDNCCQQMITLDGTDGITNFIITADTYVADHITITPGMQVTAFYDANSPVLFIFPPRYQAVLLTCTEDGEQIAFDYFDENLISSDRSLKLCPSDQTVVVTENGQTTFCGPENHYLLVYYTVSSKSIPAKAAPRKIIMMCRH